MSQGKRKDSWQMLSVNLLDVFVSRGIITSEKQWKLQMVHKDKCNVHLYNKTWICYGRELVKETQWSRAVVLYSTWSESDCQQTKCSFFEQTIIAFYMLFASQNHSLKQPKCVGCPKHFWMRDTSQVQDNSNSYKASFYWLSMFLGN